MNNNINNQSLNNPAASHLNIILQVNNIFRKIFKQWSTARVLLVLSYP